VAATEADLARRDKLDSSRTADPLRQASDAIEIDTTGMGIDEVVAHLLKLLSAR
jgi:cytidylate kinase